MARKRPSSHKREREFQKRQRERRKAERAARKRERRRNRDQQDVPPGPEDVERATGTEGGDTGSAE
jgi:hypothetical protein